MAVSRCVAPTVPLLPFGSLLLTLILDYPQACLFGAEEFSLRDMMRSGASDEDLLSVIKLAVQKKHKALGGNKDMYGIAEGNNRPMITIGG